jgi:hypothetical protein
VLPQIKLLCELSKQSYLLGFSLIKILFSCKDNEKTMPNRGTTQLNKLVDADNAHGTIDASQEIGNTSYVSCAYTLHKYLSAQTEFVNFY